MATFWHRLMTLALLLVLLVTAGGGASAATTLQGSFRGEAYGTYANATAGQAATTLGRSAFIPCGCAGTGGKTLSNTVNAVDAGNALKASQLYTTVYSNKTASSATERNTARVDKLRALGTTITADAVYAVSNTNANATSISSNASGSSFVNLRIAGTSIPANVSPNTRVTLLGIGYAVLNEEVPAGDGVSSRALTVNMIHIHVTRSNSYGLPVGSQIIVAHARSGFVRSQLPAFVSGEAFASYAVASLASTQNKFGRSAAIYLGCEGTGGKTLSNNINSLDVASLLSSGTGKTTSFGGKVNNATVAQMTATVQSLNLLGGTITADAVKGVARSSYGSTGGSASTNGSGFVNLKVLGVTEPVTISPNTRVTLPGIGYVVLYERTVSTGSSSASASVNMIHVYVTSSNSLGLPVGTQIIIAHARDRAYRA